MKVEVLVTNNFHKELKPLLKKFPTLKSELSKLEKELIANPFQGTNLGNNLFKIRLASKSKNRGKSGGFRIITFLIEESNEFIVLNLLSIYDKSELSSISEKKIEKILKSL